VCVLADTPVAQLLGGFKEGVGAAIGPCRSSDVKRDCLASVLTAAQCQMRDKTEHESRLTYIASQNRRGYSYWSKRWGITSKSVLADIPGFEVTKCILYDPMHVILEDIAKVKLKKILNTFVRQKKYFTLESLNRRMQRITHMMTLNYETKQT